MHLLHQVAGREQVGLARAGRRAAHVHAAHGAVARHDDGAAGGAAGVGEMADFDAGDVGDGTGARKWLSGRGRDMAADYGTAPSTILRMTVARSFSAPTLAMRGATWW
jgi:hypothetical protein